MSALLLLLALLIAPFRAAAEPGPPNPEAAKPAAANPAPARRYDYSAGGTEPFWGFGIANGRLVFDLNETEIVYSAPAPVRQAAPNGFVYRTPRLLAEIRHEECNDGMSDTIYADTVVVTIDGRRLDGCGGAVIPPGPLDDTHWRIREIAGLRLTDEYDHLYTMDFDRWTGAEFHNVCGTFTGPFTLEGDVLTLRLTEWYGPGRSGDAMTSGLVRDPADCTQPYRDHERRMVQILTHPMRIRFPSEGTAVISSEHGDLLLSAR